MSLVTVDGVRKAAFRCCNCGHLEPVGHAGECAVPVSCSVCSAGTTFTPRGQRIDDASNWEMLADATPERLTELGLTADDVERHEPKGSSTVTDEPKHYEVTAADGAATTDKAG